MSKQYSWGAGYSEGSRVNWEDIMSTVGDIMSAAGGHHESVRDAEYSKGLSFLPLCS